MAGAGEQEKENSALEEELAAERDAHEATLRETEAAVLELEAVRKQSGAADETAELQTRLHALEVCCQSGSAKIHVSH